MCLLCVASFVAKPQTTNIEWIILAKLAEFERSENHADNKNKIINPNEREMNEKEEKKYCLACKRITSSFHRIQCTPNAVDRYCIGRMFDLDYFFFYIFGGNTKHAHSGYIDPPCCRMVFSHKSTIVTVCLLAIHVRYIFFDYYYYYHYIVQAIVQF